MVMNNKTFYANFSNKINDSKERKNCQMPDETDEVLRLMKTTKPMNRFAR